MKTYKHAVFKTFIFLLAILFYCEFLSYYFIIYNCDWPALDKKYDNSEDKPVRAMFLSDTHLLGKIKGHWFDKLRREWQMYRSFQTAVSLHKPELVFVLGDLFDEGQFSSGISFSEYVRRFHSLFYVPDSTKMYVAVGNHDIGFHYKVTPYLANRFEGQLLAPSIQLVSVRGNHFVIVNSMAMEGDGCFLCKDAENALKNISSVLKCMKDDVNCALHKESQGTYSKPILLQHFPLYRPSDEMCTGPDSAPKERKSTKFRERWDCLSRESTAFLIETLSPRLALGGHTHDFCYIQHPIESSNEKFEEYSIPSFSWRNRNDPSFFLGVFSPLEYKISKCKMPMEDSIIKIYSVGGFFALIFLVFQLRRRKVAQIMNYKKIIID